MEDFSKWIKLLVNILKFIQFSSNFWGLLKEILDNWNLEILRGISYERITFEYLLLKDLNDGEIHVKQLKQLLRGLNAYINLIPYNNVEEKDFKASSDEDALRFYDLLKKENIAVTLRQKRGVDIDAACGQLRANKLK